MNILLLGGTGYLGSNIIAKLENEGHKVICAVRKTSDINKLKKTRVELISTDFYELESYISQEKMDWIINSVCAYKSNDTLYGDVIEANTFFPLRVLNLAIKYGVKNYMTMGTGLPEKFNIYSFSKQKFSDFGEFLSTKNKINFIDLQLEMFYGGIGEPETRFLKSCAIRLINNEDIDLTEGLQKRDIVRVEDVVNIISKLINSTYGCGYHKLAVGSGEMHSIREIIEFMKTIIDSKSTLNYGVIPQREDGEPNSYADISWFGEIGYNLEYSFFDGLKDCIEKNYMNGIINHRRNAGKER